MERNAHRLTLHSPARESLPQPLRPFIDVDQLFARFLRFIPQSHDKLQPFTTT
ncbi:hypothetical protein [Kalamiella sp. sgz302252]|uniref:hypothetical protein n=1 Tax=Pantoea sp. sgz302252 TaxID=3341827 RepID=UPI0036D20F98